MTNKALLRHRTGDYERHAEDWYVEPGWTWDVLFSRIKFDGSILDPACGRGTGLERSAAHGYEAFGSDIVNRGGSQHVCDFLSPVYPYRVDGVNVITNPPYKRAAEFAWRALAKGAKRVALLVPLPFLASQGRYLLLAEGPVSHVLVLSKRPSMPPGDIEIAATGGKEDYCWVVWTRGHPDPPVILWGMP